MEPSAFIKLVQEVETLERVFTRAELKLETAKKPLAEKYNINSLEEGEKLRRTKEVEISLLTEKIDGLRNQIESEFKDLLALVK